MNEKLSIIFLTSIIFSCGVKSFKNHNKQEINLNTSLISKELVYKTENTDFHFEVSDVIAYCKKKNNGEDNDFVYEQVITYINSSDNYPIIIPDSLATKWIKEKEIHFNDSDSLIRIRDHEHAYAYVTETVRWMIIDLTRNGNIRIYNKSSRAYEYSVIIDDVETDWYGETNITLLNDSIIFSQLRWIR